MIDHVGHVVLRGSDECGAEHDGQVTRLHLNGRKEEEEALATEPAGLLEDHKVSVNGVNASSSSVRRHLVFFTVVRDPFEMSTEEFQRFEMVIGQLVHLRGTERQDRVAVIHCCHLLAAYKGDTHQPFQLL